MASWYDMTSYFLGLTKKFKLMDERQSRMAEDIKELRTEAGQLREQIHGIDKRVAILEEGRKTTAAEVRAALTETLAAWEIARMREASQTPETPRRRLPKKDSGE